MNTDCDVCEYDGEQRAKWGGIERMDWDELKKLVEHITSNDLKEYDADILDKARHRIIHDSLNNFLVRKKGALHR